MNKYIVSHEQLEKLGNYIAMRPWVEAQPLMQLLEEITRHPAPVPPPAAEPAP